MKKIENSEELFNLLKNNYKVYRTYNDFFIMHNEKIIEYKNGSRFSLTSADFKDLYNGIDFYLIEQEDNEIDLNKDEDYYRYYKK